MYAYLDSGSLFSVHIGASHRSHREAQVYLDEETDDARFHTQLLIRRHLSSSSISPLLSFVVRAAALEDCMNTGS